ncbi:MAG: prepilin-type N-terminal cleavage/methylation domain-containing protein [Candidatus Omnitrophica bacterium]|jgi:prepilin-type N-terminal cleavage/methylation domain-containing protein|nr:prepilin-type N-terminal cleavage/methylation domain-containing protein [Candidatus Omnitrophota bacterium]
MNRRGFTLVEIMIVVAIIALLAAIAIPNLLNARKTANEAAAKANVHSLCTVAETYAASQSSGSYPAALADLGQAGTSYCLDVAGGNKTVQGYVYKCTSAATGYTFVATPNGVNNGTKTFTGTTGGQIAEAAYAG